MSLWKVLQIIHRQELSRWMSTNGLMMSYVETGCNRLKIPRRYALVDVRVDALGATL